jgi:hypothetical protein
MGAGNVSIVSTGEVSIGKTREEQVEMLAAQGFRRPVAEMYVDRVWAPDEGKKTPIDAPNMEMGAIVPRVEKNPYGKAIPIKTINADTQGKPLK